MITLKMDMGPLMTKLRRLSNSEQQRILREVVEVDARGFVRDIVGVTPPSQGKANLESKQRGAAAVARDIRRVVAPPWVTYDQIKRGDARLAAAFWQAARNKDARAMQRIASAAGVPVPREQVDADEHARRRKYGRVTGKEPTTAVLSAVVLKKYIKAAQKRVGLLAAGFLAAARRLGVKLPAWIERHPAGIGTVDMKTGRDSFFITITNQARHGRGNDLRRRVKEVLEYTKRAKRAEHALRARIRAAWRAVTPSTRGGALRAE